VARGERLSRDRESDQARRLGIDGDHANSQREKSPAFLSRISFLEIGIRATILVMMERSAMAQ